MILSIVLLYFFLIVFMIQSRWQFKKFELKQKDLEWRIESLERSRDDVAVSH